MYAKDHPDEVKFSKQTDLHFEKTKHWKAWESVLDGSEYQSYIKSGYVQYIMNSQKRLNRELKRKNHGR